ncbi:MAG: hypothetical protein ABSB59_30030 [Streptosporangiaceae bacterium]|jgi:hypothetical protein
MKPVPLLIAAAGLALLAACSGPPASAGPAQSSSPVAYSHCMRSHGVPAFPDPASNGALPKASAQQLGVSDARLQAAQNACQHLLPDATSFEQQARQCLTDGGCPQALVQQMLTADRAFARCMRSHGVPGWPDPTLDAEGRPSFDLIPAGITHSQTHSQPIAGKLAECQRLDPAQVGLESN